MLRDPDIRKSHLFHHKVQLHLQARPRHQWLQNQRRKIPEHQRTQMRH